MFFRSLNASNVHKPSRSQFLLRLALVSLLCCLFGFMLVACGGKSTGHLPKNPWRGDAPQRLEMRYVAFNYEAILQDDDTIQVSGEAFPDVTRLPDWASWYGEVHVAVYLVNGDGRVIDSQDQILPARALNREAGFPISATLTPGTARQQPLHITFGYRLSLLDNSPAQSTRRTLVAEGALDD